jgi:hypothetical protein
LYYFEGNTVDSLLIPLDKSGKAKLCFPKKDFRGLAQLVAPEAGGLELIIAEPEIEMRSTAAVLHKDSVIWTGSPENTFLDRNIHRKTQIQEQTAWLQAGREFYPPGTAGFSLIEKEKQQTQTELQSLRDSLSQSPLYAARLMQWFDFMDRLFEAEQERNPVKAHAVREEMETRADIQSLYTSGQLWGTVHNYYISLFNRVNTPDKQREYAESILTTAARLKSPQKEGFLAGALVECERFGWVLAQEMIRK